MAPRCSCLFSRFPHLFCHFFWHVAEVSYFAHVWNLILRYFFSRWYGCRISCCQVSYIGVVQNKWLAEGECRGQGAVDAFVECVRRLMSSPVRCSSAVFHIPKMLRHNGVYASTTGTKGSSQLVRHFLPVRGKFAEKEILRTVHEHNVRKCIHKNSHKSMNTYVTSNMWHWGNCHTEWFCVRSLHSLHIK